MTCTRARLNGSCFLVLTEETRGGGSKEHGPLLVWGVKGPGVEIVSAKGAGETLGGNLDRKEE